MRKLCIGLFWLSLIIAFDLPSILGKDLLLMSGMTLDAPDVPPADLIVLSVSSACYLCRPWHLFVSGFGSCGTQAHYNIDALF